LATSPACLGGIATVIEARSPGAHIFSRFPIPRLDIVLLGTILKEKGFTSTAPRAYLLADKIKTMGKKVILGGE